MEVLEFQVPTAVVQESGDKLVAEMDSPQALVFKDQTAEVLALEDKPVEEMD
jgi:hypothetical protein